ncbi:hypothetical protein BsWGS_13403 [Bradybaena similaris]
MEKQWLSCAFVQILKLGKCSGTCKFCFGIRHSSGLHKHTISFCGPRETSSFGSYSRANKGKLLEPSNDITCISEQQGSLEKVSTYVGAHSCNSRRPEVLSDTTQESRGTSSNKQLKVSDQPNTTQNIFKSLESQAGRCVRSLLHRAYRNLMDNQLLSEEQSKATVAQFLALTGRKSSHGQETASLPAHLDHIDCLDRFLQSQILQQSSVLFGSGSTKTISSDSYTLTAKEHFNYLMYLKYQSPSPSQAKILSAMFPDPAQLVYSVVKLVMRADHGHAQRLVVTDHLKQRYWKAQLTLSWPKEVTVLGLHPERDLAIFGAYLHMCEHLKNIGLIYENEHGVWVPMTADKVMVMLEKLSKYGESSLGCSRGRGFKIILKQIKNKDCDREKVSYDQDSSISKANAAAHGAENKPFGSYSQEKADAILCQEGSDFVLESKDIWSSEAVCNNSTKATSKTAVKNIENVTIPNSGVRHTSKPRWLCTIHVGWPFPFVVHAEGLSLPAAQIMGCMSVVYKLKLKQLLTYDNRELSSREIEQIVLNSTKQLWQKYSQHLTYNKTKIHKFGADAKIFCDASVMGFGAFLTFASTQKVSWLSEEWDDHKVNACLHYCSQRYPSSLLGELYTLVTAVFTWKRKLRSQRLLCHCDNLAVVSIINSFASEAAKHDTFKDPIDYLIHTLQSTCQEYSITLQAAWLCRDENQLADCLSRGDFLTFQAAVPEAAIYKTKAKILVIKGGSLL